MESERMTLAGKRALVTGGNRGIGLAVVQELVAAGAEVTFTSRRMAEVAGATCVVCDMTNRAGMTGLMAQGFDILVNNAGVIGPIGRIADVSIDDWATNIQTNLVAAFHATQLAVQGMRGKGGVIVNLSSGAAHRPMEGWSAYCAGKAGLAMLTRAVHEEYGAQGIRIYGFAPGVVDTDMQGAIRASGINPVSKIPRENLAPASDPARGIVWLCSDAAADWAGRELDVRAEDFRRACGLAVAS
jgi:NAD(P)-dependent dehydrogenase (short-subunit alcohol dehydrogenase family)